MKPKNFWRGISSVALSLLVISIGLNIVLYGQVRKYYTWLYAVELDPLGLAYFRDPQTQVPDADLPTVVFFGDSRAEQWTAPTLTDFVFLDRGIGNQTTAQVLHRFDEHIVPLRPNVIVLQVGFNDLKTLPLFPGREQEIISNCQNNIQEIVDRALNLNSVIVVTTIFPIGEIPLARRLVWSESIDAARVEVNEHIKRLGSEQVLIFDASALLTGADGKLKSEYSIDGVHLTPAGYDLLNLELVQLLEKMN